MAEKERWKVVPGWPDFKVSTLGRVMSKRPCTRYKAGWHLVGHHKPGKYSVATLSRDKPRAIGVFAYVHVLVLQTFVGPCPSGHEGRHLNDIRSDNRLCNLVWGTHLENVRDAVRNGKYKRPGHSKQARKNMKIAWVRRKARMLQAAEGDF